MYRLDKTDLFARWLDRLRDPIGKARILARLRSLSLGHFGDCASVGGGISEMRVHVGPGYRVYFMRKGPIVLLLLCAGDKSSQNRDIVQARRLAEGLAREGGER